MSLALPSKLAVIAPFSVLSEAPTALAEKSVIVSPLPSLLMVGLTDLPEKVASALPLVAVIEVFSFRASIVALNPFLVEEIRVVSLTVLSELRLRSALARVALRTNPETLSESMVTDVACLLVELMTRSVTVWAATPTSALPWAS